jgi:hypothetical protein
MRKLRPAKIEGVKKSKKQDHWTLQNLVHEYQKKFSFVILLLLKFKDDL